MEFQTVCGGKTLDVVKPWGVSTGVCRAVDTAPLLDTEAVDVCAPRRLAGIAGSTPLLV